MATMKRILSAFIVLFVLATSSFAANEALQIDALWSGLNNPTNGKSYSGAIVATFAADGSTAKAIWEDKEKTLPSTLGKAQFTLDSNGQAEVFGDGVYVIKVYAPSDTGLTSPLMTFDGLTYIINVDPSNEGVDSVDDLRGGSGGAFDGYIITLLGYYSSGDGGGQGLYWDSSSTSTDNGVSIFKATSVTTGRWLSVTPNELTVDQAGAVGVSATLNTEAFARFIAMLPDTNGALLLNDRIYSLNSDISITNKPISILGKGKGASILQFSAGGIAFETNDILDNFIAKDFTILTSGSGTDTAISVIYPSVPSSGRSGALLENLEIDVVGSGPYWVDGIYLFDAWTAAINNVTVGGIGSGIVVGTAGITLDGSSNDVRINQFYCQQMDVGIDIQGTSEGTHISDATVISARYGVRAHTDDQEPGVFITSSHFNTSLRGVSFSKRPQSFISDTLFYELTTSTESYIDISLTESNDVGINNNTFRGVGAGGTRTAVAAAGSVRARITSNQITDRSPGITFDSTSVNGITANNIPSGSSPLITDLGNNNWHNNPGYADSNVIFTDGDTTPRIDRSQSDYYQTQNNTGATSVTFFDGGYVGKVVILLANDANTTLVHSATMILNGAINFVMSSGDTVTLIYDGTRWRETSRKI